MSTLILLLYAVHSLAGIAYEVVWIKLLTASIGMTVTAFGVVLATFMAGLGLGSYVIARWKGTSEDHHGSRSTYRLVALLQTLMGLLGIAFPLFLYWGDHLYVLVAPETEGLRHLLVRGLYVGLLLLPVTTLHGMNFPVLASLLTRCATRSHTTKPGLLYCVGLLASGLGSLASLGLIPALGLQRTSLALGTTNLVLALAAFLAGNRAPGHAQSMKEETSPPRKRGTPHSAALAPLSLSALQIFGAVVGFLVISLEIIGAQYVWLIVNVTAYAEGILLSTVLLMMGLGSGLYLVLRDRVRDRSAPFMCGLFIALIAQLTVMPIAGDIASLFDRTLQELRPHELTTAQILFGDALLALTILGVPMFGLGMAFCSLCDLATSPLPGQAQEAVISPLGRLYAWHNWGALIGAVLTTFGLLTILGLTHTWLLLSASLVGTLAFLVWRIPLSSARGKTGRHHAGVPDLWGKEFTFLFLLGILAWLASDADLTFRHAAAGDSQRVLYHREDALGVTEVYEDNATLARKLLTSRLRQEGGSAPKEIRVQRIQGYLPLFLHPDPRRVLVVGLGTGITLSPTLREEVEEVTVIEISRGVIEAAKRFFAQANTRVLEHHKVRVVEQDGRNFIRLTRNAYDLIVQELFFPYQTGVGSLYTQEHYRQCRAKLAPGGLMAQWITINQLGTDDLRTLVRTFHSVFPVTSLWLNGGYLLILGGLDPLHVPLQRFLERYEVHDPLGGMPGIDSDPYNLLGLFVSHGQALREWTRDAPLNTDDNRYIEYSTPLAFNALNTVTLAAETLTSLLPHFRSLTEVVYVAPFSNDDLRDRLARVSTSSQLLMKGIVARAENRTEEAIELYAHSWELQPSNYQTRTFLEQTWAAKGHALVLEKQYDDAIPWLHKALAVNTQNLNVRFDLALSHAQQRNYQAAADFYESVIRLDPEWVQISSVWFNLGLTRYQMGLYQSAARLFREVLKRESKSISARFNLANSLAQTGEYREAVTHYQDILKAAPDHRDARANLKEILTWMEPDKQQP
ncbi:MAG: tetratricopeptide repeat protein [Nitrospira sp. SB0666_bin_27]|nr:tetratricopeptide repeat protein [Nitrospira sp. SB0666_bin_27]MYF25283.1 tetratricopeptide repeat protein [Nitrospira sp. SB0678_bin_10]